MNIVNFIKVSENIYSSGQPSELDLNLIASKGFKTIINLALNTLDNTIPNEDDIVTSLGMTYLHIPVQWNNPTKEQFWFFSKIMKQENKNKIWVHCAFNMRVSVFLYLYNIVVLKRNYSKSKDKMNLVWQPNDIWQEFISEIEKA